MTDIIIPSLDGMVESYQMNLRRADTGIELMSGAEVIMSPPKALWAAMLQLRRWQNYTQARAWRKALVQLSKLGNTFQFSPPDYTGPSNDFGSDNASFVRFPGASGDYVSTPDRSEFHFTSDLDIRALIAPKDWNPASDTNNTQQNIVSKAQTSTSKSLEFALVNARKLRLTIYQNGSTSSVSATSTVGLTAENGVPLWVRATLDADNGASGNDIKFYTSTDGVTWTQLGTTVTTSGLTVIYPGNSIIEIGSALAGTYNRFEGKIHRVKLYDGIDGTLVSEFNANDGMPGVTSFLSRTTREIWTLNGNTALKGTQYLVQTGASGQYASTPDSALLDITSDLDIRVCVSLDDYTPAGSQIFVSKIAASNYSYYFHIVATGHLNLITSPDGTEASAVSGVSTVALSTVVSNGDTIWVRATLDIDNGSSQRVYKYYTSLDGVTWTQLGATVTTSGVTSIYAGTATLQIGSGLSGTIQLLEGKIYRAVVFDGIRDNHLTKHVNLSGASGSYVSTPDSLLLDITGDIEIIAHIRPDDWTPGSSFDVVDKSNSTGDQRSYVLRLVTTGELQLAWSTTGTAGSTIFATSTVAVSGVTNGDARWIRVTLDVNDGTGNYDVTFYTSTTNGSWVQLGSVVTAATPTSIYASTALLEIGSINSGTSNLFNGQIYRALVYGNNLVCTGASGQYARIPDEAALDVVDLDLYALLAPADWTPSSDQTICAKYLDSTNNRSFRLDLTTTGALMFYWSADGTNVLTSTSTVTIGAATGIADARPLWIRVTIDVDNGAAGRDVKFYYSSNGTSFTQLGATVTSAGVTSIYPSTATFEMGSLNAGNNQRFIGKIYRVEVYNGIAGTLVAGIDFQRATVGQSSFVCVTGQTVTLTSPASIEQTLRADFNPDLDADINDSSFTSSVTIGTEVYTVNGTALITDGRVADFWPDHDAAVSASPFTGWMGNVWTINGTARIAHSIPIVNGASQLGLDLDVDGLPPNTVIALVGDYMEVNGEFKALTEDAITSTTGTCNLKFEPALRSAPSDNTVVDLQHPSLTARLLQSQAEWTVQPGRHYDVPLQLVETYGP